MPRPSAPPGLLRRATISDVEALTTLEARCFASDRISARAFRRLLGNPRCDCLVLEEDGRLLGYGLTLYRRNTSIARLYSLAVVPEARGRGLGRRLLERLESTARDRGSVSMRLEVRADNAAGLALYRTLGYSVFGTAAGYYEDGGDALRMEKEIVPHIPAAHGRVPYYAQTLDFTCGAAALLMAMRALDDTVRLDQTSELRIWREATTIFMSAGHGGCAPFGLAIAAIYRGFQVEVFAPDSEASGFLDTVRDPVKKEVIRLVEQDQRREALASGAVYHPRPIRTRELIAGFNDGAIPLVLVSAYRLTGDRSPHWIVVTATDDRFVYINDPYIELDERESESACIGIPVSHNELERMSRYGKGRAYGVVLVSKPRV